MQQSQFELQLKVWKELAISKQVLMRTAAVALKLTPDCTQEELQQALDSAIKKIAESDANVIAAREQARISIAEMERKVTASAQAQAVAETAQARMRAIQEKAAPQIAAERAAAAKELQKVQALLNEKERALKAINAALADTPDNVLKKMKELKKQKQNEADARRQLEGTLSEVRKKAQEREQLTKAALENSVKLAAQHRELHAAGTKLHEQLKPLLADAKDLPNLPELDTKLVESIDKAEAATEKVAAEKTAA